MEVKSRQIVMPNDTNPSGYLFGGVLLSWIDMAAAMVAQKHSRMEVTTVHMDELNFKSPIKLGDHVIIKAKLVEVGRTSMKIQINFHSENPKEGTTTPVNCAVMTFVGLKNGQPSVVPPL